MSYRWFRLSLNCLSVGSLLTLGLGCGGGGYYDEYSEEEVGTTSQALSAGQVLVNQLGYRTDMTKIAAVYGSGCNGKTFSLKKGSTVLTTGTTSAAVTDPASGDIVCKADFSSYTTAQTGVVIEVSGVSSRQFNISSTNQYGNLYTDALNYFVYHRAGSQSVTISLPGSTGNTVSRSWALRPRTGLSAYNLWTSGTFNIDGCHVDAGDFGIYPDNFAHAQWALGNAYEMFGGSSLKTEVVYGAKCAPGFLPADTTKQASHKCHDDSWDTQIWGGSAANADNVGTDKRHCMGPSITATYSLARTLAHAARVDSANSAYWTAAKNAWARANKSTSGTYAGPSPGAAIGGGDYPDMNASDDLFSAAVEIYLTAKAKNDSTTAADARAVITGSSHYKKISRLMDWEHDYTQGNLSLMAYHMKSSISSEIDVAGIQTAITTEADSALSSIANNGYPTPVAGNNCPWGSNKVVVHAAIIMAYAHKLTGNCKYLKGISQSMDYLLGQNALDYSFITGYGVSNRFEKATHDRQADGNSPKGWLSGGPINASEANDPVTPKGSYCAKNYYLSDSGWRDAWASRENTIDWNGPLVWVAQYLATASRTNCASATCNPTTCTAEGAECGSISDGCSVTLNCGGCGTGETCTSNQCVANGGGYTGAGSISYERWNNLTGTSINTNALNTTPSQTGTFTSFEAATNSGDNYQMRVRGYVTAPTTGNYTFWLASDDNGELYLSTSDNPANKVKIASVTGYTGSREWGKMTSQKSAVKSLTGGQKYYIEVVFKEGVGGDNMAVGWAKPGQSTTAPSEVIPGIQLSPFSGGTCSLPTCSTGQCGTLTNSCGSTTCGGCGSNQTCSNNQCVNNSCTLPTCGTGQCGTLTNSCGSVTCGTCSTGYTCSANQCISSGGGGGTLGCSTSNSTSLSAGAEANLKAGTCYSFNKASGTFKFGNWSGTTFSANLEDSAGASFSATVPSGDWKDVAGMANGTGFFKVSVNVRAQWNAW